MGARSTGSQHPTTTKADGHLIEYFRQTFGSGGGGTNFVDSPPGIVATGGTRTTYVDGSGKYAVHTFTSSGSLVVSSLSTNPSISDNCDFLVIGGGGGGTSDNVGSGAPEGRANAGGGAGGYRTSTPEGPGGPSPSAESALTLAVATYPVTVGGGGAGADGPPAGAGTLVLPLYLHIHHHSISRWWWWWNL